MLAFLGQIHRLDTLQEGIPPALQSDHIALEFRFFPNGIEEGRILHTKRIEEAAPLSLLQSFNRLARTS